MVPAIGSLRGLPTEHGAGRRIDAGGIAGTYAAFDPTGALIALVTDQGPTARSVFGWQTPE